MYGTAQLQGNVRTLLKWVRDTSEMRVGRVWDALSGMSLRYVHASTKPRDKATAKCM